MLSGPFSALYDGDGLRATKSGTLPGTTGAVATYFLNGADGQPVVEEQYNAGTGATTVTAANGFAADGLRARYQPGDVFCYDFAYDPQGDVAQRQTRREFAEGSWAYDVSAYEGYGALRADYGAQGTGAGHAPAHRDQSGFGGEWGYYTDPETGLLCLTHRYHDPGTGRFVTRDPAGYGGGVNLYGFADDNPVTETDPSGLQGMSMGPYHGNNQNAHIVRNFNVNAHNLMWEFMTGKGTRHSVFIPGDEFTNQVQEMDSLNPVRQIIVHNAQKGIKTYGNLDFNYGTMPITERLGNQVTDGIEGWPVVTHSDPNNDYGSGDSKNPASAFLGSYELWVQTSHIDVVRRTIEVDFHLYNAASLASVLRNPITGYNPGYQPAVANEFVIGDPDNGSRYTFHKITK